MPSHKELLENLRENEIKAHKAKLAALDALIGVTDKDGKLPQEFLNVALQVVKTYPRPEIPTPAAPAPPKAPAALGSLEDSVEKLMRVSSAGQQWTARGVYEQLVAKNSYTFAVGMDKDTAANSVSTILIKMMTDGKFKRIVHGKGRRASVYEWIGEVEKEANPEEKTS